MTDRLVVGCMLVVMCLLAVFCLLAGREMLRRRRWSGSMSDLVFGWMFVVAGGALGFLIAVALYQAGTGGALDLHWMLGGSAEGVRLQ